MAWFRKSHRLSQSPLVRLNRFLSWIAVGFGLYLVALPLIPHIHFYFDAWRQPPVAPAQNIALSPRVAQAVTSENVISVPEDNRLQIPGIGVDGTIHEGTSIDLLNKGIWRRPKTSTPDKGGNTVLVAHRFLYRSGPNTFYLLDKVAIGDEITVWWNKSRYTYKVIETKTVEPDALEIEHSTDDARLTLYTCAPLFSSSHRLVVIAKPVGK
jgi:sortase A